MAYKHNLPDLPYSYDSLDGISEQVVKWHHNKHHAGYVDGRNEVEEKLEKMREEDDFSGIRSVKLSESHNASGMILHNIYWEVMGGEGGKPEGELLEKIEEDFGSYETWKKEFKAVANAGRGWAILCYDMSDGRLHNYMVDFHNQGAVWGAYPLLPVDVWEHAYYYDQGPNKEPYLKAFFDNLNWSKVESQYKEIAS